MENLSVPSVVLVTMSALLLLLVIDWRSRLIILAIQYLGVFTLTSFSWSMQQAATKLVAGWITAAVLGMAILSQKSLLIHQNPIGDDTRPRKRTQLSGIRLAHPFYLPVAILVVLAVLSIAPLMEDFIPIISRELSLASLFLIGLGIIQLSLNTEALASIVGLLTILSGFEIAYSVVESAVLIAGLLALVTLGIGVTGAYLILAPFMEEQK